ncbi:MAG: outer membrane protein assembly factor BamE [Gammaproteobacteria bacterium]|nr:outer membrane protein assembly factor BamE [Gammaproteobacteria bacterium]MBU1480118.1 outer membrane protein assembly factor BamE [Gammaproteobacteria bacterium]
MRIQLLLVSVLLASCSLPTFTPYKVEIRQGNLITQDMRAKIKLGMTQSQVKAALGAPLINDPYHANRWDYVYRFETDGELKDNQRLTLYFANDVLKRIVDATPLTASGHSTQEEK